MFFNRNTCCGCNNNCGGCMNNCGGCNNNCGCNNGCGCNTCCPPVRPVPQTYVCYCSRYVDVPMNIYYGSGYTEIDCCEDTLEVLQEISNTLKQGNRNGRCGGCGCC